jgi:hypothetical protein
MSKREREHVVCTDPQRIRDEIASLEARLVEIGYDGDCAYEKAMIRFFEQQVAMRRNWLQVG